MLWVLHTSKVVATSPTSGGALDALLAASE